MNEQFVELFDLDLVTLPPNLPDWLIDQQQMLVRTIESNIAVILTATSFNMRLQAEERTEYDQKLILASAQ